MSDGRKTFVSVVICTYGRATALQALLHALEAQKYAEFEVLVIDGNGESSPAREAIEEYVRRPNACRNVVVIASEKGLTRQRNVGLRVAAGELICFLDDDVTFGEEFLQDVVELFGRPDMQDVGGVTPYDTLHYPTPVNLRWRLRALFGVMPGMEPGRVDHLGRAVPLSFLRPWSGRKEIGWLPGFCMIYRRTAIEGLEFDELLPTYGGEDRDFSMRVARTSRLLICGDLHIEHHYTVEGREDGIGRLRESSFGVGRRFAKYGLGLRDYPAMARTLAGDFVVDMIAFVRSPSAASLLTPFARMQACVAGMRSVRTNEMQRAKPARGVRLGENRTPIPVSSERDN
jgi:glycosyltransferase involved in cell wall biosynthesis